MPNETRRDKRKAGNGAVSARRHRQTAQSAASILAASGLLPGLAGQLDLQSAWREWLRQRLPAPLPERLAGVVECDGCLTLLAASGAWAARLRYALKDIDAEIRAHAPQLTTIRVRVMPPG